MSDSITLYRFLNLPAALKSIEKRNLRVGRISEFNDPFEWRLGIKGGSEEEDVILDAQLRVEIDQLNRNIGVVCFSNAEDDPVLWATYADNHTGVVLEFDYAIDDEGTLKKIEYSDNRPLIDAEWLHKGDDGKAKIKPVYEKMFNQKASSWAYEREYRVHVELENCETGNGSYFTPIRGNFLTRVILGFRCPVEEQYIRRALKQAGFENTEVRRARMDHYSYRILY